MWTLVEGLISLLCSHKYLVTQASMQVSGQGMVMPVLQIFINKGCTLEKEHRVAHHSGISVVASTEMPPTWGYLPAAIM